MASRSKKSKPAAAETTELTAEQQQLLQEQAAERVEKAAQCELELVRLFLMHEKHEIARRRLQTILSRFAKTQAAAEADRILQSL